MIITRQKPYQDLRTVIGESPVFLIGCSQCATLCHTGGEEEVLALKNALEHDGVTVTGWIVLDPACHLHNSKRLLKPFQKQVGDARKVVVLACGNGVQTVAELFEDKLVLPGTDTLFLGEIKRVTEFEKRCSLCGDCLLEFFEGICPISRCPKSMLNGPCGGIQGGKCEVESVGDCVWVVLYEKLKALGHEQKLKVVQSPKQWSKSAEQKRRSDDDELQ